MKHSARAALAVSVLVAPYVLAAVAAAGLVIGGIVLIASGHPIIGVVLLGAVAVAGVLVLRHVGRARPEQTDPGGIVLGEDAQPTLWEEVRMLADLAQTRAPDEIRLVAGTGVMVTEETRRLGLVGGRRRLFVGVPLLQMLTRNQLRSVLTHELGHLSTRSPLAATVYRGQVTLARAAQRAAGRPLAGPFGVYHRVFTAAARPVCHRQELDADQLSAQVAGPDAAAAALRELPVMAAAWSFYLTEYVALGTPHGMRPIRLFDSFTTMMTDPDRRQELEELRDSLHEPDTSLPGSHPPLAVRLAALTTGEAPGLSDESGPARGLLHYSGPAFLAVEDQHFEGSGLTPAPLDVIVNLAGVEQATEMSRALFGRMERRGLVPATLGGILDTLAAARPEPLLDLVPVDESDPESPADQQRSVLAELVGGAVAYALVDGRRATYHISWAGPWRLVDTGGSEVRPRELAEDAIDSPGYAAALRAWLQQLDIKLDSAGPADQAPPSDPIDPGAPTGYLGAVAPVSGSGFRTLLVTDSGLLLVRPSLSDTLTLGLTGAGRAGATLVRRYLARPPADLAAEQRVMTVPWSEIRALHLTQGAKHHSVGLTLHDNRGWTLRWSASVEDQGTVWAPIEHFLGGRFTAA